MKDGLWSIVDGSEPCPDQATEADKYAKYVGRRDRALAVIVLSVDPALLYLIGDPDDPAKVWKKLSDQFQKKTWANKLALRRKLYALRLREGGAVQEHIKEMTELFDELSVVGDPLSDEDRVVHLLASLPESYDTLVTALEANTAVPSMEVVTERLLHEERRQTDRGDTNGEKAMTSEQRLRRRGVRCHYCKRLGHIKRDCFELASDERSEAAKKNGRQSANKAEVRRYRRESSSSESESVGLVTRHAMSASVQRPESWVVDSGATCHMCNDEQLFVNIQYLKQPQKVTLGDGHVLKATGIGTVEVQADLGGGNTRRCKLRNVLHVPQLSYNLFSVPRATELGTTIRFDKTNCCILDDKNNPIATASKIGSLYYLNCYPNRAHVANSQQHVTKEDVWHRRLGHLGEQNLQRLARSELVIGFDYDA